MEENNAATEQPSGPQFAIQRTFIKDLSFETPMGVKVFTQAFQPKVKMDVNTRGNSIAEGVHEIVLTLTITAKVEEDTAYIVELQQAGIFAINGFPKEQMAHVLGAVCPNFLFPYAREAVDSIVVKGGFPPLSIAPIDFDAIFRQSQASADQSGQSLN
ncbi:MAG: protein-export chaperone SecB [Pseudomonadota bacterium]|nr:protein-export chaperone SecB [Pseudomonadota bacterium]